MVKNFKISNEIKKSIEKAIKIYYQTAFKLEVEEKELENLISGMKEQLEDHYFGELRLGIKGWPHTKLSAELHDRFQFYLFANCPKGIRRKIEKGCSKIEKELIKANLPVRIIYSK